MTLAPGARLGPYEIVAPLGAGGMGEVWRAKDTRLGREVAVKVLAGHLSDQPEVRARFEREAKTVSTLQHPHICVLHDVGREQDVDFLVMELVEGETLAARLARGALPAAELARLGAQVADALDAAHRAGVVHRDLKPGNIMLTRAGAKLMDFGLARVTGLAPRAGSGGSALTQSPTVAGALTAEGTIVGTFQYMAPEQLEGVEADARADVWALGCVLYEMATGRRAFEGRSQASLISAIMSAAPAPLSQLVPLAPVALERLVAACLAKDPRDRIQSAHDVKLQLEWLVEPGSVSGVSAAGAPTPTRVRAARPWLVPAALVVAALGLAAAGAAWWTVATRREPTTVTQLVMPRDLVPVPWRSCVKLSPDGRRVVVCARRGDAAFQVWQWALDAPDPRPVEGVEAATFPAWSPDGRSLAFVNNAEKSIQRSSIAGGGTIRIAEASDARGLDWGARDWIVYAPTASGPLLKVPASGGTPEPATELDTARHEGSHRFPSFLPDGEHFLFASLPAGPRGYAIRVGSLRSKTSKVVTEANSGAVYAAPGWLLFVEGRNLVAQRFDVRSLSVKGERIVIADAPPPTDFDAELPVSVSRTGTLAFLSRLHPEGRLVWLGGDGIPRDTVSVQAGDWILHAFSPDGSQVLATRGDELQQVDVVRGMSSTLLRGGDASASAVWSPDGSRIVASSREGSGEVLQFLAPGGGIRDSVPGERALFYDPQAWTPDGKALVVGVLGRTRRDADPNSSWDLWTFPLDGRAPSAWLATGAFERWARLSPDGRWLAAFVRGDGREDLIVDSYPVPGHRVLVRSAGVGSWGGYYGWERSGAALRFTTDDGRLVRVPLARAGDRLLPGPLEPLFRLPADAVSLESPDGVRFLAVCDPASLVPSSVRLVQHWEGLVRR